MKFRRYIFCRSPMPWTGSPDDYTVFIIYYWTSPICSFAFENWHLIFLLAKSLMNK